MLKIGVLGEEKGIAAIVIKELLKKNAVKFFFAEVKSAEEINESFMEAVLKKSKILILDINVYEDYENLMALRFDILLFLTNEKKNQVTLSALLKEKNYLIVDSDSYSVKKIIATEGSKVITCGFNTRACVSVSSVEMKITSQIQCCLQRTIETIEGREVEPREIKYAGKYYEKNVVNIVAALVVAIITGVNV